MDTDPRLAVSHADTYCSPHFHGLLLLLVVEIRLIRSQNHLDVGYNGIPGIGFINNILNIYFHEYYPRALQIAQDMRELGGTDRFVYTTHPWLMSLYLDCPPNMNLSGIVLQCPDEAAVRGLSSVHRCAISSPRSQIAAFKAGVMQGDIVWHAGPFNLQPENMEPTLFEAALGIADDINAIFGFNKVRA